VQAPTAPSPRASSSPGPNLVRAAQPCDRLLLVDFIRI
jgi:hypothetical protein